MVLFKSKLPIRIIDYVNGAVYVANETNLDAADLYLYGYGASNLFGAWPGAQAEAATENINGVDYLVFKSDKMIASGKYQFIVNNNADWQTADMAEEDAITLNADNKAYIRAKADKTIEAVQ